MVEAVEQVMLLVEMDKMLGHLLVVVALRSRVSSLC